MGGKGKRRNQHGGGSQTPGGKKQKQASNKSKEDGDGTAVVLTRSKKSSSAGSFPVPGLMNLGNTCFFNSVMQNLAQTHYLRQRMGEILSTEKMSVELPSPRDSLPSLSLTVDTKPGKFAQDFHTFIGEMRSKPKQPLNPRAVFNHVCKNASRFSSYQQQDSQELLRYLLDALRNEEIHRIKKAILDNYNVKKKSDEKVPITENEKKAIKAYGMQALQASTYVEDVFGGKITSCITCLECKTCCKMEEDFLDLSLPVPAESSKSGFASRSSLKNKKRVVRNSSEDAEGDDEGEGLHYGNHKMKTKDEPPRLSKHQLKQKRKEERKRSKGGNRRYTLDQFHKDETLDQLDTIQPELESEGNGIMNDTLLTSSSSGMIRSLSVDTHDSCLADDEVALHSTTQQDSEDSSAPCMRPVGNETQEVFQKFSYNVSSDEKTDEQKDGGFFLKEEELSARVQDLSLIDKNQNLSESLVATFEANENIIDQADTPLHSPRDKDTKPTVTPQSTLTSLNTDEAKPEECEPKFGRRQSSPVSVIEVTTGLQNIGETNDQSDNEECRQEGQERNIDLKKEKEEDTPLTVNEATGDSNIPRTDNNSPTTSINTATIDDDTPRTKQQVNKFSLEHCLKQFTSREILTGSEKFYCESCSQTKRSSTLKSNSNSPTAHQTDTTSPTQNIGDDEQPNKASDESRLSADIDKSDDKLSALVERDEASYSPDERSGSSTSSNNSCKDEDEDTEMLESTKESDDNMDEDSRCSSIEGIVLREAEKQMLINRLPAVLCLHLKRFIQQGRNFKNMRKNSCFISFPMVLDIAPYCTNSCKSSTGNRILYSLYGIVVHGGGMHGGHYTAFVRLRTELDLNNIRGIPSEDHTSPDRSTSNKQDNISDSNVEGATGLPNTEINAIQSSNKPPSSSSQNIVESPSLSSDGAKARDTTSKIRCQFDLSSSTEGAWYHVSDSHVRKSSEAEVLKAEAYLLFYERLPCTVKRS